MKILYNGTVVACVPLFMIFLLLCDNNNAIACCLHETMLSKDYFMIRGFNCIHLTSRDIGGR